MPIVFNFLYIFLKKLKLIEPSTSVISVAEKNFIGMEEVVGRGGYGDRRSKPNFKD